MTVADLLTHMSAAELSLWADYYRRYGFTNERTEWATAIAGTVMAGTMGWKGKAADLIPKFQPQRRGSSPEQIKAFLLGCTAERFNGRK